MSTAWVLTGFAVLLMWAALGTGAWGYQRLSNTAAAAALGLTMIVILLLNSII